jgi:hypothetical protein
VRAHADKLRCKEEHKYAVAKAKQAAGGHHLYDTVAGNAVVGAPLGPELLTFWRDLVNWTIDCCGVVCGLAPTFQVWGCERNLC